MSVISSTLLAILAGIIMLSSSTTGNVRGLNGTKPGHLLRGVTVIENPLPEEAAAEPSSSSRRAHLMRRRRSLVSSSRRRQSRAVFQNVVYEGLGKFDAGFGSKYFGHHYCVPDKPQNINPTFLIYVPEMEEPQTVDYFNLTATVKQLRMDFNREFFIGVHGFRDSHDNVWFVNLKQAIVDRHKNNLMILGWPKGSQVTSYYLAAANTRVVGAMLANVLQQMDDYEKAEITRTTIIGHSLGSHIAGFAGEALNGGLRGIIALDPAGPLFNGDTVQPQARLDQTDASMVQAIHTNGESLLSAGGFGQLSQLGHVDFYPNGGANQPGCNGGIPAALGSIFSLDFTKSVDNLACSHNRVIWLFIEMLKKEKKPGACRPKAFPGCKDSSDWLNGNCFACEPTTGCPNPGLSIVPESTFKGKYYFSTLAENITTGEYCGAQYRVQVRAKSSVSGAINLELHGIFGILVTVEVQKASDTLKANQTRSRVIMAPWGFELEKVRVLYNKRSFLIRSASQTVSIDEVVITREDGHRYVIDEHELEDDNIAEFTVNSPER